MNNIARSPKQVGHIIQQFRKLKGMSQADLAGLAGLRQEQISRIEGGAIESKISTIFDLLAALDLELTINPRTSKSSVRIEDIF